jgi:hypothetical protein
MMLAEADAHSMVYQVLDEVLAARAVSPGARGTMFAVVDGLRAGAAALEDVRRAENVSIALHRLETALQRGDCGASDSALAELRNLAADWLNTRICTRH